jgi:hypothetical protein
MTRERGQDPYVRVRLPTMRVDGPEHSAGGTEPKWDHTFQLVRDVVAGPVHRESRRCAQDVVPSLSGDWQVDIEVVDKEVLVDRLIGSRAMPLAELVALAPGKPHWLPLVAKDGQPAGELSVTL